MFLKIFSTQTFVEFIFTVYVHKTKKYINGALSGLRQFWAIESLLKIIMQTTFYFTLKALFVLKIFKFLS